MSATEKKTTKGRRPTAKKPTPKKPTPKKKAGRRGDERSGKGGGGGDMLYGRHAIEAAIKNPHRRIKRIFASANAAHDFEELINKHQIELSLKTTPELAALVQQGAVHQGVAAHVEPLPETTLADLKPDRPVLVLDQVTDPHNVGAILRSAAVFNAAAVIMTRRNSPPLSGALAKSACGGLEHVNVILVGNLSQALRELGEIGFYRIGLAGEAQEELESVEHPRPVALALGAEGKGLRRLTRENCDSLRRINATGPLASLNVSNAAAVALHAISKSGGG